MWNGIVSNIELRKPMVDKLRILHIVAIQSMERLITACFVLISYNNFLNKLPSINKPPLLPSVFFMNTPCIKYNRWYTKDNALEYYLNINKCTIQYNTIQYNIIINVTTLSGQLIVSSELNSCFPHLQLSTSCETTLAPSLS